MRDPARIDQVLDAIRNIWSLQPDLRLGQLLINVIQVSEPCPRVYSIEDTELLRKLESAAKRWGGDEM